MLQSLPADTGMAFVLVQHLDPDHASALTQILARATAMPVRQVTDRLRVEPNHVYVIPPNTALGLAKGMLTLRPRPGHRVTPSSIDSFFEALALDRRERAVGVILSGTATDGTIGLEAIKAAGGITFAQDDSAKYDSMPRHALAAGCVDLVLSPEAMAKELTRIARHPFVAGRTLKAGSKHLFEADESVLRKIVRLLHVHSGVDFSRYKSATLHRRITRRAVLNQCGSLALYAEFLVGNAKELDMLYADALIGVTSFFRNADAFELLGRKVFPKLLAEGGDGPLRVWVLGCSTGQEAYSLAMIFAECADLRPHPRQLQVFATDLNETSLAKARRGVYAKSLVADVSPARLRRFFMEEDDGYRVNKPLRDQIVFARHNLIGDPPFSRMDLISCRNLLIYFEPALQKKVIPMLHFALKPRGVLLLGASESVGGFEALFAALDKKQKIYASKPGPAPVIELPVRPDRGVASLPVPSGSPLRSQPSADGTVVFPIELTAEREADRITLNQFAPPAVLINAEFQILQFRGATDAYLAPPTGKASFDLLKMARDGLVLPLRTLIALARRTHRTARHEAVKFERGGESCSVNLQVVQLKNLKQPCWLVFFETPGLLAGAPAAVPARVLDAGEATDRIAALERDLADARDYLQSVEEKQDAANEELQAANEEGQSANEELQSLNEELETSKEELESTNEELTTVNEEMLHRNAELTRLNADLSNLETSTQLVIFLIGRDGAIRRFSQQAAKRFALVPADRGRPIGHLRHDLVLPDLAALVSRVIASGRELEREVRTIEGRWFSLRVRPYLNAVGQNEGAVVVLLDIDELKSTEQAIAAERERADAIIRTISKPLVILSAGLRIESANAAFYQAFKLRPKEVIGREIFTLDRGAWEVPRLRFLLEEILPKETSFANFELTHHFGRIGSRSLLLNARRLDESGGRPKVILLGIQDITELLTFQVRLRQSELRYRRLFETAKDGILILDPATRKIVDANPFILKLLRYPRAQLIGRELWEIGLLKDEAASQEAVRELKEEGYVRYEDLPLLTKDGQRREVEFVSNLYEAEGRAVIQCNIRDITARKHAEEALRASEERYRNLFNSIDEGFCTIEMIVDARGKATDYRFIEVTPSFEQQTGIRDATGKRARMIFPTIEAFWLETYGKVAKTGRPIRFTHEFPELKKWFDLYAFRPGGPGSQKVAVLVRDITQRKHHEAALLAAQGKLNEHATKLEFVVAARTAELTIANRRLIAAASATEHDRRELQVALEVSEAMQKKLRSLARKVLTAQEDERRHISRELHDDVVQSLVGINVELSALGQAGATGRRAFKAKLAHTQRLVEKSVQSVHQFARELRPALLDDLGLIPALHAYTKQVAKRGKLKIQLTAFGGVEQLDSVKRTVLYRVVQEALTNVVRHAHAQIVHVAITAIPLGVRLLVHDDGKSFPVAQVLAANANQRLGLVGLRERVEMVGGTVTFASAPGQGTKLTAEIPFGVFPKLISP